MATGHEIAIVLRTAYLLMHRQTNSFLSPFGITADQFVLLAILANQDGITQQELTRRASSDPNTIRAMLVLMEKKGLVKRQSHSVDKRARSIMLTDMGKQLFTKLSMQIKPLQEALQSPYRDEESDALVRFLDRMSKAMMQWESEHKAIKQNKKNY